METPMISQLMKVQGLRAHNLSLAVAAATAAMAAGNASAEEWQWTVTPYIWATDLGIDVTVADRGLVDAEIPFEELVDTLDSATLVRVEGVRGEHGMAFDLFNVKLVGYESVALPGERDAALTLDTSVRLSILDATGVYDTGADREGFSLVYGTRVIEQRNRFDAALVADGLTTGTGSYETTDTLVDGLIGFRYVRELPNNFSYQLAADVSTGDTEYTWSAGPTVSYAFGAGERYEVTAGYRHMVVDFDTAEHVDADMSMSGLSVGFRVEF
jgi:hypothetical protein